MSTTTDVAPARRHRVPRSAPATVRHLARRALLAEAGSWASLARAAGRRPAVGAGVEAFSYDRALRLVLGVVVVASALEVVVVDLIVHPWPWVRWPLLALGVWGVLFSAGMVAGYRMRPHTVGPDGLRVRMGAGLDLHLPWAQVHGVSQRARRVEGAPQLSLQDEADGTWLNVAPQKETHVQVRLEEPTALPLPAGPATVVGVRLGVDDPAAWMEAVRRHIP